MTIPVKQGRRTYLGHIYEHPYYSGVYQIVFKRHRQKPVVPPQL